VSIYAPASSTFTAEFHGAATGLVGTVAVQVLDAAGTVVIARSSAGIVEAPAGSGVYIATRTAPATAGAYTVLWDTGTVTPDTTAIEDLEVAAAAASTGVTVETGGGGRVLRGRAQTVTVTFLGSSGAAVDPSRRQRPSG
jgi:hypothetical protein